MANNMKSYLLIVIIIVLGFHVSGILGESGTPNSKIFNMVTNPQEFRTSDFVLGMIITVGALAVTGVAVGLLTKNWDIALWSPLYALFISLGADLIGVFLVLSRVNLILGIFAVSPLMIIYALAGIEWVRGI